MSVDAFSHARNGRTHVLALWASFLPPLFSVPGLQDLINFLPSRQPGELNRVIVYTYPLLIISEQARDSIPVYLFSRQRCQPLGPKDKECAGPKILNTHVRNKVYKSSHP